MKKFSENINKIEENVKIVETIEDKLSKIIDDNIFTIEFNDEPDFLNDTIVEGKEQLKKQLISLFNEKLELSKQLIKENYSKKYINSLNKAEIDILIENLKSK